MTNPAAGWKPAATSPPAFTRAPSAQSDPYQADYERAKAAGFPQPGQSAKSEQRSSTNAGPFILVLGGISLIAAIVLQFVKVSADGSSISAAQANGICTSPLGQLGQGFSGTSGNNTIAAACGRAAVIEDWKGITTWLAIVLICAGLAVLAHRPGLATSRASGQRADTAKHPAAQQSPDEMLAAAQRAEANAARLREQAAQMKAEQAQRPAAWSPVPPAPAPGTPGPADS